MKHFTASCFWKIPSRHVRCFSGLVRRHKPLLTGGLISALSFAVVNRVCGQQTYSFSSSADEDDMLARLLVQDAFHPPLRSEDVNVEKGGPTPKCNLIRKERNEQEDMVAASQENSVAAPISDGSAIPKTVSLSVSSRTPSAKVPALRADDTSFESHVGYSGNVTDSRSLHAAAEPFAVVRRAPSTVTGATCTSLGEMGELEWMCLQCNTYNAFHSLEGQYVCRGCEAPGAASHRRAKPPIRHVPLMPAAWMCTHCTHVNSATTAPRKSTVSATTPNAAFREQRSNFICSRCEEPFTGVQVWTCPQCEHLCPRAATQCPTCFSQRPVQWTCKTCKHKKNSIFSLRCNHCKTKRPMRVSNSIEVCAFCNSWNDVRWELCATCMAFTAAMTGEAASSRETAGAAQGRRNTTLRERWKNIADPLKCDAHGRLHSKTVEMLCSPRPLTYQQKFDGDAGDGDESAIGLTTTIVRRRLPMLLLDNAWWCSTCNVPQRRNANFCDVCLQSRDHILRKQREQLEKVKTEQRQQLSQTSSAGTLLSESVSVIPATANGDWRCPYCCQLHALEERECCGHQREVPPGYWLCGRCGSTNGKKRATCLGCGQAQERVCAWTCAECAYRNEAETCICGQCGLPHRQIGRAFSQDVVLNSASVEPSDVVIPSPTSVACPVCAAPNLAKRMACYRCRARLHDVEWTCQTCGEGHHDRQGTRCARCKAFRAFDLNEEVWMCEVCSTAVYSGGELPVRTQCPKCQAARAVTAPHFPARWRCSCGLYNRARVKSCPECGTQRRLPTFDTVVSCPHCFRDTRLDVAEMCEHCCESLSNFFEGCENLIRSDATTRSTRSSRDDIDAEDGEDTEAAAFLASGDARV